MFFYILYFINRFVDINFKEKVEIKSVRISMVGDLLYEESYYDSIELGDDKSVYLSKMKYYFFNDDLSLTILEVVITDGNHTNNRGLKGRVSTINYFKNNSNIGRNL